MNAFTYDYCHGRDEAPCYIPVHPENFGEPTQHHLDVSPKVVDTYTETKTFFESSEKILITEWKRFVIFIILLYSPHEHCLNWTGTDRLTINITQSNKLTQTDYHQVVTSRVPVH